MYRKVYSYNDMPHVPQSVREEKKPQHENTVLKREEDKPRGIFSNLQKDDIILIAAVFLLLMDDCDDLLLIGALALVFLTREG